MQRFPLHGSVWEEKAVKGSMQGEHVTGRAHQASPTNSSELAELEEVAKSFMQNKRIRLS